MEKVVQLFLDILTEKKNMFRNWSRLLLCFFLSARVNKPHYWRDYLSFFWEKTVNMTHFNSFYCLITFCFWLACTAFAPLLDGFHVHIQYNFPQ